MKRIGLYLVMGIFACSVSGMVFSSCKQKAEPAEQVDGFMNTIADESADSYAKKRNQSTAKTGMEIPGKMKNTPEQILHRKIGRAHV